MRKHEEHLYATYGDNSSPKHYEHLLNSLLQNVITHTHTHTHTQINKQGEQQKRKFLKFKNSNGQGKHAEKIDYNFATAAEL